ncbi:cytochrome C oxidase subunit IV family protein [Brevibacillus fulvus]|uniref:Cytochrome c oxidase subunit 4 n=1 Tax=Brevibacillus fulvus TaxID=1125967 RepID=A0A939BT27_9BACL|nr:cytochrome C oxidase subunit IV family protein [Brevibacillus fulvus]MBM7591093.1 cytochrome c oxidase subunit 4 [Brevibacillus fulvus]
MSAHVSNESTHRTPKVKKSGAKAHLVTFIVSIVLTALAFIAVGYEVIPIGFTVPFIILLAIVQAAFQLFVWMHLDQKGHEFPRIGILMGVVVVAATVFTFVYWLW